MGSKNDSVFKELSPLTDPTSKTSSPYNDPAIFPRGHFIAAEPIYNGCVRFENGSEICETLMNCKM